METVSIGKDVVAISVTITDIQRRLAQVEEQVAQISVEINSQTPPTIPAEWVVTD